jgi:CheY-like chemotaxis protein
MVETGALSAWKTSGGHRRVLASSLNDYMRSRQSGLKAVPSQSLSILVLEDDDDMRAHYKGRVAEWGIDVNLQLEPSGLNALLHIAKHRPDIVITDLNMANLDGFDMITSLRRDQSFATLQGYVTAKEAAKVRAQ